MPKSSSKKIDMILNYDETKRVMVMADRDRIKQVFINILDNALKFTDEGGVVLTDIKIEEDKAIIEVIDNGCGISEDEISLVTGKFYKGTNSNSHTGLGLSICEKSKSSVTIFPNLSLSFSIILNPSSKSLLPLASGCKVKAHPFITVSGVLNS